MWIIRDFVKKNFKLLNFVKKIKKFLYQTLAIFF